MKVVAASDFVSTRSLRGGEWAVGISQDRVSVFLSSGVMISIKSIDRDIGHESSVGFFSRRDYKYMASGRRHG